MSENTLLVPGLHNSGPEHWQSHWHQRFPHWRRVTEQRWSEPDLVSWSDKVAQHLAAASDKIHLVAHSFGTLASIAAARRHADKVASLLIVAPADPANFQIPDELLAGTLPFPALLVASDNDPWMSHERAHYWSRLWQVPLFEAGAAGHINADSGHGAWLEGLELCLQLHARATVR